MRHLILLASLVLPAGAVVAEDVVVVPLPPENVSGAERSPAVRASSETQTDQARAVQEIALLRRMLNETAREKVLFGLFSSPAAPIDGELLREMDRYIHRHLDEPETAEVYHLKAQLHQRMGDHPAAALDWLMLTVVHPDSAFAAEARKRLDELHGNQLKKQSALLDEMLRWTKSLGGDRDHRIATFLRTVSISSNEPVFAAPLAAECAAFPVYNRSYPNGDDIQHALARQALLIDAQVAIYHFDKLLTLYPDSPFRPDSLLSIANAQRNAQRAYEQAAQNYRLLIERHPDTAEAAQGHEALAEMYDQDMRDYPKALGTYEAIVAKYRDTAIVLRALNAMAAIYRDRTNQPAKAVDSYLRIADTFRGPEVVDALNKAGKIAQYTLHDWNQAIYINDRVASHAPGSEDAAQAMFANAGITEEKLHDKREARVRYERLIAAQPDHPLAKEARKRIEAMERR